MKKTRCDHNALTYFHGSSLEKKIKKNAADMGYVIPEDDMIARIIRAFVLTVSVIILESEDPKFSVVLSYGNKGVVRFIKKRNDIVGDFSIKHPGKLKPQPLYACDEEFLKRFREICRRDYGFSVVTRITDFYGVFILNVFNSIKEWLAENPSKTLNVFSTFDANETDLFVDYCILSNAKDIVKNNRN